MNMKHTKMLLAITAIGLTGLAFADAAPKGNCCCLFAVVPVVFLAIALFSAPRLKK